MRFLFIEISNYILAIIGVFYAFLGLLIFTVKHSVGRSVIAGLQNMANFSVIVMGFLTLYLSTHNKHYLLIGGLVTAFILLVLILTGQIYRNTNRVLLNNMCMLLSIGLLIISRVSLNKATKQFIIIAVCYLFCMFLPLLFQKVDVSKKLLWVYAGLGIILLSSVLLLGKITHGSKLSLSIGPFSFQPSEMVKVLYVFFLAAFLWENLSWKKVIVSALISALHIIILVMSRDLGSALIFFISYLFILVIATGNYLFLLFGLLLGCGASVIAYRVFSHVQIRVAIWKDPWSMIDGKGYQITQSLFSITSGGMWGTGLLRGTPTTIPYAETDFVFSVICEEMGLLFAFALLLICISSFAEMQRISVKINDYFYKLVVYGLSICLIFQVFLTVGGGTKFIPLTGVTLPFVSYGGTSVIASMVMYFAVQSIYIKLRNTKRISPINEKSTKK